MVALAPVAFGRLASQVSNTGHTQGRGPSFAGSYPADKMGPVVAALLAVKSAGFTGNPLADQPGILIDQDAHAMSSEVGAAWTDGLGVRIGNAIVHRSARHHGRDYR